jgi:uncharacterized protein (TIGR02996 family)
MRRPQLDLGLRGMLGRGRGGQPVTDDHAAFLRAIIAEPDDDRPRLIFSDWLYEHGEPEAGGVHPRAVSNWRRAADSSALLRAPGTGGGNVSPAPAWRLLIPAGRGRPSMTVARGEKDFHALPTRASCCRPTSISVGDRLKPRRGAAEFPASVGPPRLRRRGCLLLARLARPPRRPARRLPHPPRQGRAGAAADVAPLATSCGLNSDRADWPASTSVQRLSPPSSPASASSLPPARPAGDRRRSPADASRPAAGGSWMKCAGTSPATSASPRRCCASLRRDQAVGHRRAARVRQQKL